MQGRNSLHALGLKLLPVSVDGAPEKACKQKAHRDGLTLLNTLVGALKGKSYKRKGLMLFLLTALGLKDHVHKRQAAMMQAIAAQLLQP